MMLSGVRLTVLLQTTSMSYNLQVQDLLKIWLSCQNWSSNIFLAVFAVVFALLF